MSLMVLGDHSTVSLLATFTIFANSEINVKDALPEGDLGEC